MKKPGLNSRARIVSKYSSARNMSLGEQGPPKVSLVIPFPQEQSWNGGLAKVSLVILKRQMEVKVDLPRILKLS